MCFTLPPIWTILIGEAEGASKGTVNNKKINQLIIHAANYIVENDIDIVSLSISHVLFGNADKF